MGPDVEAILRAMTGPTLTSAEMSSGSGSGDGIVARAKAGEAVAQRLLIRRYQRPVGALLHRMLVPAGLDTLVDDLAQETFIRAFGALRGFDLSGPARFSTWLFKIASRLAINELNRRRPPIESLPTTEEVLPSRSSADADHRRARIAKAIEDAVAALAPEFRAAFLMREYHGLDYDEIAATLELDLGTVKSRLFRARRALRARLEDVRDD